VTTPRGRGSAARDRARGSVRVAEIGGKVAARRSVSFIPLRRPDQAWARATRSAGNSGMNGRRIRSQDRIV